MHVGVKSAFFFFMKNVLVKEPSKIARLLERAFEMNESSAVREKLQEKRCHDSLLCLFSLTANLRREQKSMTVKHQRYLVSQ